MATVNFSVPDEVKKAFDRTFKGTLAVDASVVVKRLLTGQAASAALTTVRR